MARKKTAAPKHVEPEDESQDVEEPETEETDSTSSQGKAISKAAAVRDALEQGEESPEDGVAYIKKIHGIEISKQMFSSYKTQEKARQAKKGGAPKGKPGRKSTTWQSQKDAPPIESYFTPESKQPSGEEPDLIEAMEAMKPLVASLGAEKVKRIVDLLS